MKAKAGECAVAGLALIVLVVFSPLWLPFWVIGRLTQRWWDD